MFSRPKAIRHRRIEVTGQDGDGLRADLDLRAFKRGGRIELGAAAYDICATGAVHERWRCERDGRELFADPNIGLLLLLTIVANHAYDQESAAGASAAGTAGAT